MKKIKRFEAYQDESGNLFLALFDDEDQMYFFGGYEEYQGIMSGNITRILNDDLTVEEVEGWDDCHNEWYEEICTGEYCDLIATEAGPVEPERWGYNASEELAELYGIESEE